MEFTKEEISLCKQIVEKHRKKIGEGDWYVSDGSDYRTGWSNPMLNTNDYEPVKVRLIGIGDETNRNDVPLWTIPDCLEFLRTKGFSCFHVDFDGDEVTLAVDNLRDGISASFLAKTPLEACLKAVLAVLEEK